MVFILCFGNHGVYRLKLAVKETGSQTGLVQECNVLEGCYVLRNVCKSTKVPNLMCNIVESLTCF